MRRENVIKYGIIAVIFIVCGIFYSINFKEESISLSSIEGTEQADLGKDQELSLSENQNKENTVSTVVETEQLEPEEEKKASIFVYVCGEVNAPGVYELLSGARVYEAVEAAGGLSENAADNYVNLAQVIDDGEKILIPCKEDILNGTVTALENGSAQASSEPGKININTADADALTTLPGIGEAKANSIISYREANKGFKSKEELMQIEGIKEGVYNKIKDLIIIN